MRVESLAAAGAKGVAHCVYAIRWNCNDSMKLSSKLSSGDGATLVLGTQRSILSHTTIYLLSQIHSSVAYLLAPADSPRRAARF